MSKISAVKTENAPAAMAVYSQAIVANGFVYCSGTSLESLMQDKSPRIVLELLSMVISKLILYLCGSGNARNNVLII
jgi:hypothetical protein